MEMLHIQLISGVERSVWSEDVTERVISLSWYFKPQDSRKSPKKCLKIEQTMIPMTDPCILSLNDLENEKAQIVPSWT